MSEKQNSGDRQKKDSDQQQDRGRSVAEWTTFGVSAAILVLLVGAIIAQFFTQRNEPAIIQVQPQIDSIRQSEGFYYLPVDVTNQGGLTAQDLRVQVSLQGSSNAPETATFSVRFLPGGDHRSGVVGFHQNPKGGQLSFVVSYLQP